MRSFPGFGGATIVLMFTICLCVACSVSVSHDRRLATPQSACGLEPSASCDQDTALCIAKTQLGPGESALRVKVLDLRDQVSHDQVLLSSVGPVWGIILTTGLGKAGSQCGSTGREVWVSQRDGRIIKSWPWGVDCVS
jgi:hypothetical protein